VRFRVLAHVILLTQAWPGALRPMLRTKVGGCGIREIESGGSPAEPGSQWMTCPKREPAPATAWA
jgi:hypothetical protein